MIGISGSVMTVHQLHCEGWRDMENPKDTKVLLDLYKEVENVLNKNPGTTMMVHCSAGVGRTGAFIGLFKLVQDFNNDKVSARTKVWSQHLLIFSPPTSGDGAGSVRDSSDHAETEDVYGSEADAVQLHVQMSGQLCQRNPHRTHLDYLEFIIILPGIL